MPAPNANGAKPAAARMSALRSSSNTALLCAILLLTACSSLPPEADWPGELPLRSEFVRAYQADPENAERQQLDNYLTWIIRFYDGNRMVGSSWKDVTDGIVHGLEDDAIANARGSLHELGMLIASEWAKTNDVRVIDTRMLSLWGSVMLAADAPTERLAAMELISRDVADLLAGRRHPGSITEPRYEKALALTLRF